MMKKTIPLLGVFTVLMICSGCEKIRPTVWMEYHETGCSDPWFGNNTEAIETEKKVKEFLKKNDVKVFDVELSSDGIPEACFACFCKTGRIIACKVKEKDVETMEAFGFQSR